MISNSVVEVIRREESGKNASRRARAAGKIPGILYGLARPSFSVTVDPRKIEQILHTKTGRNTIFNLQLSGKDENKSRAVMLRDLQRDPVSEDLLHVDFIRIDMDAKVTVDVLIHLLGEAVGVELEDGVIDFIHRSVQVECLPNDIPEFLELDISETHIGQNLEVSDLIAVDNIEILDDDDTTILTVSVKRAEEVEEVEEGEEGDEAEVAEGEEGEAKPEEGTDGKDEKDGGKA
jgi:large subunit ribosomal protein L25